MPREVFRGKQARREDVEKRLRDLDLFSHKTKATSATSRDDYKARLSSHRRDNLQEGIRELYERKHNARRLRSARSKEASVKKQAALHAPEREDERLTGGSTNVDLKTYIQRGTTVEESGEILAKARARHAQLLDSKKQERLNDLHTLYAKARGFIVNEQQLSAAIEDAFGTDDSPKLFESDFGVGSEAHSIWALGKPDGIETKLSQSKDGGRNRLHAPDLTTQRMKRMAEALTGGDFGDDVQQLPTKQADARSRPSSA